MGTTKLFAVGGIRFDLAQEASLVSWARVNWSQRSLCATDSAVRISLL
jgi:hypothetical protein